MLYPTGMLHNSTELSRYLFCMCLPRNFDSSSQKDTFLHYMRWYSNYLNWWSLLLMFYPTDMIGNLTELSMYLFCMCLLRNLYSSSQKDTFLYYIG